MRLGRLGMEGEEEGCWRDDGMWSGVGWRCV